MTGMYFISFRILGLHDGRTIFRFKKVLPRTVQENGKGKDERERKKEKIPNDNLFIATRNYHIPLGLSGLE